MKRDRLADLTALWLSSCSIAKYNNVLLYFSTNLAILMSKVCSACLKFIWVFSTIRPHFWNFHAQTACCGCHAMLVYAYSLIHNGFCNTLTEIIKKKNLLSLTAVATCTWTKCGLITDKARLFINFYNTIHNKNICSVI